jgi:hypothetical protein
LSILWKRKGIPVHSANRLQRWAATLREFRIQYRKSTDFDHADAIRRLITAHIEPVEEMVLAALQAEFDMNVLTSYLPVIFDKLRSSTENDALLKKGNKFIKSRWPGLIILRQHATGRNSKASTGAVNPSRLNKEVTCSGNVWSFQPRCGPKFSNSFTNDIRGSNELSH